MNRAWLKFSTQIVFRIIYNTFFYIFLNTIKIYLIIDGNVVYKRVVILRNHSFKKYLLLKKINSLISMKYFPERASVLTLLIIQNGTEKCYKYNRKISLCV